MYSHISEVKFHECVIVSEPPLDLLIKAQHHHKVSRGEFLFCTNNNNLEKQTAKITRKTLLQQNNTQINGCQYKVNYCFAKLTIFELCEDQTLHH